MPDVSSIGGADELMREQLATFVLGPKGRHFDGDDWERRADLLVSPKAGEYLRGEVDRLYRLEAIGGTDERERRAIKRLLDCWYEFEDSVDAQLVLNALAPFIEELSEVALADEREREDR